MSYYHALPVKDKQTHTHVSSDHDNYFYQIQVQQDTRDRNHYKDVKTYFQWDIQGLSLGTAGHVHISEMATQERIVGIILTIPEDT